MLNPKIIFLADFSLRLSLKLKAKFLMVVVEDEDEDEVRQTIWPL